MKTTSRTERISSPASTGETTTSYQIYSTVLGAELTSVNGTDNTKIETKVFAGGAQIANQKNNVVKP